jgi:hypothetical protein
MARPAGGGRLTRESCGRQGRGGRGHEQVRFVIGNRNRPTDGTKPSERIAGDRRPEVAASIVPQHSSSPDILSK